MLRHDARIRSATANAPGIDPNTGLECKPLTPEIAERVGRYAKGHRPKRLAASENPVFFAPGTGSPIVWYAREKNGMVEIFDLMGYHPQTGEEFIPISKDIVSVWNDQNRQARNAFTPTTIPPFFQSRNGSTKCVASQIRDRRLRVLQSSRILPPHGRTSYCCRSGDDCGMERIPQSEYRHAMLRTDEESVRYGTQLGIDAETGRQCRPFSAEMLARLKEYEKGNRPKRIDVSQPTFFDLRSGEPAIWYAKGKSGNIELFSLMGFRPDHWR